MAGCYQGPPLAGAPSLAPYCMPISTQIVNQSCLPSSGLYKPLNHASMTVLMQVSYLLIGVEMAGPLPFRMSNSMPSTGRGVRISLNMMTPSGWKALHGCRDSSVAISAFSDLSRKGSLSEYLQRHQNLRKREDILE